MFNRFATINAGFPADQMYVIVLINQESLSALQMLDQMHNSLFGKEIKKP